MKKPVSGKGVYYAGYISFEIGEEWGKLRVSVFDTWSVNWDALADFKGNHLF